MYTNRHVDSSIQENQFTTAARCVIFAGRQGSATLTPVGIVQGYGWSENRQVDMIFELGSDLPYLVPGRTTGQISLSRMLLYGRDLLNVIYNTAADDQREWIKSLREITEPCRLAFASYTNGDNPIAYSRLFDSCWIAARNESVAAGQTLIAENVSVMYQSIINVEFQTS